MFQNTIDTLTQSFHMDESNQLIYSFVNYIFSQKRGCSGMSGHSVESRQHAIKKLWLCIYIYRYIYIHMQGVLLPGRQALRGDSRHEDKHY